MTVTIRPATPADLADLVRLSAALFAEDGGTRDRYTDVGWPARAGARYFTAVVAGDTTACWVADVADGVAGYLVGRDMGTSETRPVHVVELESMYVRPAHRGGGIGTGLVGRFRDWAVSRGAGRLAVSAFASNEGALRFYRRSGFTDHSVRLECEPAPGR
jgi:GNAT superfamily N-acetyltransferase